MTENLENLLREWASIEPDRCELVCERSRDSGPVFHFLALELRAQINSDGSLSIGGLLATEGSVQEAIKARGWIWHMQNGFDQDGRDCYVAYLSCINDEEEFACGTPAEALLSAYLQALKANA